jgi:hypothetical protein
LIIAPTGGTVCTPPADAEPSPQLIDATNWRPVIDVNVATVPENPGEPACTENPCATRFWGTALTDPAHSKAAIDPAIPTATARHLDMR